ncbi:hypothetical protein BDZ89DRAFT_1047549 [Hymenopellis radicata]|nr:hypothetical protein BDZ89DRAFT_1047549 [Hymenopellis radicata]
MFFWGGTAPKSDAVESISELRSNQCTLSLHFDAHAIATHRRAPRVNRWNSVSHAYAVLRSAPPCRFLRNYSMSISFPSLVKAMHTWTVTLIAYVSNGYPDAKPLPKLSSRRILWEKVVIRANDYNAAGDVAVPFMASQEILDCIRVVEFLHPITPHTIDYVLHRFIKVREVTFTHEISRREGCVRWFSLRTIQLRHVHVDYQLLHRVNTLTPHMVVLALLGGVVLGNAGGRPPLKIPSLHLVLGNTVKNTTTSDRKILFDMQGLQAFNAYGYACSPCIDFLPDNLQSETTGFMDVANVTSLKELWLSFHLFRSGSSAGQLLMGAADNATTLTVTHLEVFVMGPSRNILQTARITNLISLALAELVSARVCVDIRWRCLYHEEEDSQRLRARQEMCAYMGALARETAPAYIQETVEDLCVSDVASWEWAGWHACPRA